MVGFIWNKEIIQKMADTTMEFVYKMSYKIGWIIWMNQGFMLMKHHFSTCWLKTYDF